MRIEFKLATDYFDYGLGSKAHEWKVVIEDASMFGFDLLMPQMIYHSLILSVKNDGYTKMTRLSLHPKRNYYPVWVSGRDCHILGLDHRCGVYDYLVSQRELTMRRIESKVLQYSKPVYLLDYYNQMLKYHNEKSINNNAAERFRHTLKRMFTCEF